jgi:kinesin family protein 5
VLTYQQNAFALASAGIKGGQDLAESAKDMERIRKTMASQLADFDTMKKALMKDLQDRCEKVRSAAEHNLAA